METNYIYLLQEREFLKTKEDIFKVGMTTKKNHERFNQYPKGSILLFQMICKNCKNIEKQIITSFKENFKQRKDIGIEYFQGNYKNMIDFIYITIKNEIEDDIKIEEPLKEEIPEEEISEEETSKEETSKEEMSKEETSEEENMYEITTYKEWIKYNEISKIIITDKRRTEGYIKFKGNGQLWMDFGKDECFLLFFRRYSKCLKKMITSNKMFVSFSDIHNFIYSYKNINTCEFITQIEYRDITILDKETKYCQIFNKFVNVNYDFSSIHEDILTNCYFKKSDLIKYDIFYNLKYHEYLVTCESNGYFLFNSLNFTFKQIDDEITNNKILQLKDSSVRGLYIKNIVDISIVNDILNSLINTETKRRYKQLTYSLLVEQNEKQIIFYDYNECLLTSWLKDLLFALKGEEFYMSSCEYYETKRDIDNHRCIMIYKDQKLSIKKQIEYFCKLGFRNIIVCQEDNMNNMYNIVNFKKYFQDNKKILLNCLKTENNYEPKNLENDISKIFYNSFLLLTNYLKWCCIK